MLTDKIQHGLRYYETSAATASGVEQLFTTIGKVLLGALLKPQDSLISLDVVAEEGKAERLMEKEESGVD